MAASKQSFEQNMNALEEIVKELEDGDITLDKMLSLYEKGIALTKKCSSELDKAEQKINVLTKDRESGAIVEKPFEPKE